MAERTLASLRGLAAPTAEFRPALESEFPQLGFEAYRAFGAEFERLGFRCLGDVEDMRSTTEPHAIHRPTLIRGFLSPDGAIVGAFWQVRSDWKKSLRGVARGMRNLRWIAAPRSFVRSWVIHNFVSLTSELEAGVFVRTSTAQPAGVFSVGPAFRDDSHPEHTPVERLLARHRERLAGLSETLGSRARTFANAEEALASTARAIAARAAHRRAIGLVTRDEMRGMSSGEWELADAIYDEMQEILRERAERS